MTGAAPPGRWALTLYVNGASASSVQAIENVRLVCDEDLRGDADLTIIDARGDLRRVAADGIFALPTLIRHAPGPRLRVVGDLSDPARLRTCLGLDPVPGGPSQVGA